jgi:hypothetical protein
VRVSRAGRAVNAPLARTLHGAPAVSGHDVAVPALPARAACTGPDIDRSLGRHPLKIFVCFRALDARDVHTGELPGDPWHYERAHGERYPREALTPTREFTALRHCDRDLAARFEPGEVPQEDADAPDATR